MTKVKFDNIQLELIFNNKIQGIKKENPNSICVNHFDNQTIRQIDFNGVNTQNFIVGSKFIQAAIRGKLKNRKKEIYQT